MRHPKYILPIIVFAQFCCTSLWFAGNGIITDLVNTFNLGNSAIGHLTSAVQFGFILGTFLFALLTITDRFSPSKVFFISAVISAFFNLGMLYIGNTLISLLIMRFLTGFFLAGIYPVGMKIASDYFQKGLGKSLGFLVGALVLGTSFPHLLKGLGGFLSWELVVYITSGLAVFGGLIMLFLVPNGPYRKSASKLDVSVILKVFKEPKFKSAAFGYFGHMWELYAFWGFIPMLFFAYERLHEHVQFNIPIMSFIVIAVGGFACVISGYASEKFGTKKVAAFSLFCSFLCCLFSPLFLLLAPKMLFISFLIFWGMVVIADSPLFSTLEAQNVAIESKGTALTIVNSIGFAITIVSIQLLNSMKNSLDITYLFMLLAIGPVFGLLALYEKKKN